MIYRIGGLSIETGELAFDGEDSYDAGHKFVVESFENTALIYVAKGRGHWRVFDKFQLSSRNIVGGGSLYVKNEKLVLDDWSGRYGAISKEAAQKFAELIIPEIEKLGVKTNSIEVNPLESRVNRFWKTHT